MKSKFLKANTVFYAIFFCCKYQYVAHKTKDIHNSTSESTDYITAMIEKSLKLQVPSTNTRLQSEKSAGRKVHFLNL